MHGFRGQDIQVGQYVREWTELDAEAEREGRSVDFLEGLNRVRRNTESGKSWCPYKEIPKWPSRRQYRVWRLIHPEYGNLSYAEAAHRLGVSEQAIGEIMRRMRTTHPFAFNFRSKRKFVSWDYLVGWAGDEEYDGTGVGFCIEDHIVRQF